MSKRAKKQSTGKGFGFARALPCKNIEIPSNLTESDRKIQIDLLDDRKGSFKSDIRTNLAPIGIDFGIEVKGMNYNDGLDIQNLKGLVLATDLIRFMLNIQHKKVIDPRLVHDFGRVNFFTELYGLYRINPCPDRNPFNSARLILFTACCCLFSSDDLAKERVVSLIRESGKVMYQSDGMNGLQDPLFWLFIPKSWERFIDHCFDGIGNWRA